MITEVIVNVFRGISGVLVFLMCVYTFRKYQFLPDKIPVHFDFEQKPDKFGSKKFVLLMPCMAIFSIVLFDFAVEFPESANYPIEINENNKLHQFAIMQIFMSWLCILVIVIFFNIQDYMIRLSCDSGAKPKMHLGLPLVFIFLSLVATVIISSIYK